MPIWDEPVQTGAVGAAVGGGAAAAMGASLNSKAVDSMASEAREMLKSAKSGGFRVSEEAAQPIIDVLEEMKGRVEELRHEFMVIASMEPTLGAHDYGKQVAAHQHEAFSGTEGSASQVLYELFHVLEDAQAALQVAVEKYKESELASSEAFRGQV